jgi:ABC-type antimicrobial peptide transport system permease subunit
VALIISTTVVSKQLNYMMNKNLGFSKENIAYVSFSPNGREKYDLLKEQVTKISGVKGITCSNALPNRVGNSTSSVDWEGKNPDENYLFTTLVAHFDFLDVFDMKLVEGRTWDQSLTSDSLGMIINQEAARIIGFENPVGEKLNLWGYDFEIIGVVENFNFQSLKQKVEPLVMFITIPWQNTVSIKLNSNNIVSTMEQVEKTWNSVYPNDTFKYNFFDQLFDSMYRSEMRMVKVFSYFSFLAILISCLGLFGLATFMAEQRFKEIGIRKTLGANEKSIVWLMVWDFVKWVLLANVTGWLLAFYAMEYWLSTYAYRIDLHYLYFLISGVISIVVAILTVSYQSWRVSRVNPVLALKYE